LVPKLSRERLREIEADTSRYAPLVHSVGGVDGRDERLAITRPWGHPRLAAYGMEVTAPAKKVEKGYTEPLTGTSMSAAIVSGIAAGVWRARPTLTAAEVIGLVYSSGRLLDAKAGNRWTRTEYCLNKQDERCEKWPPRRASFCEAMKIAADSKLKCVNPAEALTAEYYPPVPPPPATPGPVSDPCKISNCGGLVGPMAVQMSSHVMPQPGTTVCPSCVLKLSYAFGHGAVYGTATLRPVATLQSTYVRTYDPYSNPQDFLIPNPTSGSPFTSLLNPPANTASAVNNWYYQIGTIYLTDTTSLIVQP
jgi:hypothetical protein